MTGTLRVYRWEVAKLLAQKRTYLGLITAMIVPIVFVVVLVLQTGGPNDVPLGRYIRQTGLAVPFVVLFFMSGTGHVVSTSDFHAWATEQQTAQEPFSKYLGPFSRAYFPLPLHRAG